MDKRAGVRNRRSSKEGGRGSQGLGEINRSLEVEEPRLFVIEDPELGQTGLCGRLLACVRVELRLVHREEAALAAVGRPHVLVELHHDIGAAGDPLRDEQRDLKSGSGEASGQGDAQKRPRRAR